MKLRTLSPLYVLLGACFAALFIFIAAEALGLSFTLNHTKSLPVGIYALFSPGEAARGKLVTFNPSGRLLSFQRKVPWLVRGEMFLKPVGALPGDEVCIQGRTLLINGIMVSTLRPRDRLGKRLPHWRGCKVVPKGEFLPLSLYHKSSFDGRYFGLVKTASIRHSAFPLITF